MFVIFFFKLNYNFLKLSIIHVLEDAYSKNHLDIFYTTLKPTFKYLNLTHLVHVLESLDLFLGFPNQHSDFHPLESQCLQSNHLFWRKT